MVGLVRIATKVIQGFIYLKLNYLSSGAPKNIAVSDCFGLLVLLDSLETLGLLGSLARLMKPTTQKKTPLPACTIGAFH